MLASLFKWLEKMPTIRLQMKDNLSVSAAISKSLRAGINNKEVRNLFHNTCAKTICSMIGMALAVSITMSGCSTISDWFVDDEELEIRRLKPIEAKFTPKLVDLDIGDGASLLLSSSPCLCL